MHFISTITEHYIIYLTFLVKIRPAAPPGCTTGTLLIGVIVCYTIVSNMQCVEHYNLLQLLHYLCALLNTY